MGKPSRWEFIVLHHSFSTDEATTRNWDAIRKYHKNVNGWTDIGYHWGIENVNGTLTILEGRPMTRDGAHAIGFNSNGIGICLVGNYDMEAPSAARLEALSGLVTQLMAEHGIPAMNVIGHRETYKMRGVDQGKTCPGSAFDLDAFRRSLTDSKG